MASNRRILAFSPGTALKHSSVFDKPGEEVEQLRKSLERSWPSDEGKPFRTPTRRKRKTCTILASELEDPILPGFFCLSPSNSFFSWSSSDVWTKRFHELPVVYLSMLASAISFRRIVIIIVVFVKPTWLLLFLHRFLYHWFVLSAAFLDVRSCIRLQRVCQSWKSGLSTESVYKLLYQRRLLPQKIGTRSYARSWKTLFLNHNQLTGNF